MTKKRRQEKNMRECAILMSLATAMIFASMYYAVFFCGETASDTSFTKSALMLVLPFFGSLLFWGMYFKYYLDNRFDELATSPNQPLQLPDAAGVRSGKSVL